MSKLSNNMLGRDGTYGVQISSYQFAETRAAQSGVLEGLIRPARCF